MTFPASYTRFMNLLRMLFHLLHTSCHYGLLYRYGHNISHYNLFEGL